MSHKSIYQLIGCVIIILVVLFAIAKVQKSNLTVTPDSTIVTLTTITSTMPPTTPITVVMVTPVQTEVPILTTVSNEVIVTEMPIQVSEISTFTESPVITPEPTAVPIKELTSEFTAMAVTSEVPKLFPTTTLILEDTEKKYKTVENELSKITIMGGIYPDYNSVPAYDLYNYIDVSGLEQARLFEIVRKPYESGIAQWININFATEDSAIDRLSFALNSSICGKCGRVKIVEAPTNLSQITAIFDEIEQDGTQEAANRFLLDYLYKYTRQNPDNPYERLIISCND